MARQTNGSHGSPAPTGRLRMLAAAVGLLAAVSLPPLVHAQTNPSNPFSAEAIQDGLSQKYDAGATRSLAPAQACYRQALILMSARRTSEAIRLLSAAADFDPAFPDAHFTLARVLIFRSPGQSIAELTEGLKILAQSYPWQRHLLANAATGLMAVWMISLFLAVAGITLRHLPHLVHIVRELMSPVGTWWTRAAATVTTLSPALWGLGLVPTLTIFAGLISFRLGKREALLVGLFLASALCLTGGIGAISPWAGSPTLEEPSLLVDRAMNSGYDAELAAALLAWESKDPNEPLFPYAMGSMARRSGDFDLAERQLTLAAVLKPKTYWILTNLGNVYFAREDYPRARQTYEAAAEAAPNAVEPHFNLAQVYTKQLMFTEASREQSRASSIAFDRVSDFSRFTAPQLNRTVMDAHPSNQSLWALAGRFAPQRGPSAYQGNFLLQWVDHMTPPAPFALVFIPALFLIFAGVGQLLGRSLPTYYCSNCQKVVCRRCVKRMQQRVFCNECFKAVKELKSSEFTRLLLGRKGQSAARRRTAGQAILTFILPGAGQTLRGATLSGFLALLVMSFAAVLVVWNGSLVPSLDVLAFPVGGWAKRIPLAILFVVIYAATVFRYFATTTSKVESLTAYLDHDSVRSVTEAPARERGRP